MQYIETQIIAVPSTEISKAAAKDLGEAHEDEKFLKALIKDKLGENKNDAENKLAQAEAEKK